MTTFSRHVFVPLLLTLMLPAVASAQWAAKPGETVRNGFGPLKGESASMCRGACGLGCPSSCKTRVSYECLDSDRLIRVKSYICSTHQGCREHDDCLDACEKRGIEGLDCGAYCHSEAVETYGVENAVAWAAGGGPTDGPPIFFQYTHEAPDMPEPAFRCPEGSKVHCARKKGSCIIAGAGDIEPVFDSYPSADPGAMRIAGFRSGHLCGESVCQQTTLIQVSGRDTCERGPCTRYGVEFDFENADPSMPLECTGEVTGGGDFVGNMLKKGADMIPQQGDGSGEDGMAELVGMFQQILKSADTPEDVRITVTPMDEHGNPIKSQSIGNQYTGPASVPRTVVIPSAEGHMVVPMYQLMETTNPPEARMVRCSHKGIPVLEVAFQLQY
ncbi:MAG: hypothetical protein HKO85_08205 [Xanthomonadales bacterium]|nr:hypothetical protein [Gammaproteobacteria bacterium]MBT8051698.1 hypothetical protein [Gammaproteobacteria bacterium]MBT8057133.1 hypothetical protein [Gammaproteobacteria bacterium]NNJ79127.1 hypothetical protein [Xanthomonadales bacterium]NNL05260.1 hypothetical protein [Xanthomonadales bacterium]